VNRYCKNVKNTNENLKLVENLQIILKIDREKLAKVSEVRRVIG